MTFFEHHPELGALILTLLCAPLQLIVHLLLLYSLRQANGLHLMLWAWAAYTGVGLALLHLLDIFSASACLVTLPLTTAVMLGYSMVYIMTGRGFSLRMMVDLEAAGSLSADELYTGYSDGRGIDGLVQHRLDGLRNSGLVAADHDRLQLTAGGAMATGLIRTAQRLLHIGRGG
ncbi:MAG: hypothetical protein AAF492_32475 [Verrucomicrobiota bacterium]